jgi:transposase
MGRRHRRYDKQFKLDALRMVSESDRSLTSIARDLGIHPNLLYKWRDQFEADPDNAFPGEGKLKPEDEALRKLRREVETLKEERDILKKALAVFSRRGG